MTGEVCHAYNTSFCRLSSAFLLRKFTSKSNTTPGVSRRRHNLAWGIFTLTAYMRGPARKGYQVYMYAESRERVGKSVISVCKKAQKANRRILRLWKNRKYVLVLWFRHILKTVNLWQLKGMQSSKLGTCKRVPLVNRQKTKRVPSCQN